MKKSVFGALFVFCAAAVFAHGPAAVFEREGAACECKTCNAATNECNECKCVAAEREVIVEGKPGFRPGFKHGINRAQCKAGKGAYAFGKCTVKKQRKACTTQKESKPCGCKHHHKAKEGKTRHHKNHMMKKETKKCHKDKECAAKK